MTVQQQMLGTVAIQWDDGLVDYTEFRSFSDVVDGELNRINKEVAPDYIGQQKAELRKSVQANVKHWEEQIKSKTSEVEEQLKILHSQAKDIKKDTRNLTSEEVSVLAYRASVLKSQIAMLRDSNEFDTFKQELLDSSDQIKTAFIDNAHDVLKAYGGDLGESQIRRIIEDVKNSMKSEEDIELEKNLNEQIKVAEREKISLNTTFTVIQRNVRELENKINSLSNPNTDPWG